MYLLLNLKHIHIKITLSLYEYVKCKSDSWIWKGENDEKKYNFIFNSNKYIFYDFLNKIRDKWYIKDTNLIKDITNSAKITFLIMIVYMCIILPFLFYINFWRSDLKVEEKRRWSLVIIFLNIIGIGLFYFKVMKKKKE